MGCLCGKPANESQVETHRQCAQEDFAVADLFRVEHCLGRGAGGETWMCKDMSTGDTVAVKFIKRPLPKAVLPMLCQEVKIQAMLGEGHVGIVQARQLFLTKTHLELAMECMPGGTLADYLTREWTPCRPRKGLSEDEARYFFKQFLEAVDYLHMNHVAHRDIKLDNIVLDGRTPPRIKLIDFGFAKGWDERDTARAHTPIGTPVYMCPQRLNSSKHGYNTKRADLWSCGVLLYALLLGKFPFEHASELGPDDTEALTEVWRQQAQGSWRTPKQAQLLSEDCRDLLDKMFELDEALRPDCEAIRQHPWYRAPLPAEYELALAGLRTEQAAVQQQLLSRPRDTKARERALQRLVNQAGSEHCSGADLVPTPRLWLARGASPYGLDAADVDVESTEDAGDEAADQKP
ncbi:kinase-like domain-containing protein [Haematococcus lacustris]